jgi:hypothetical protein
MAQEKCRMPSPPDEILDCCRVQILEEYKPKGSIAFSAKRHVPRGSLGKRAKGGFVTLARLTSAMPQP